MLFAARNAFGDEEQGEGGAVHPGDATGKPAHPALWSLPLICAFIFAGTCCMQLGTECSCSWGTAGGMDSRAKLARKSASLCRSGGVSTGGQPCGGWGTCPPGAGHPEKQEPTGAAAAAAAGGGLQRVQRSGRGWRWTRLRRCFPVAIQGPNCSGASGYVLDAAENASTPLLERGLILNYRCPGFACCQHYSWPAEVSAVQGTSPREQQGGLEQCPREPPAESQAVVGCQ
jgi:hypothetical protein